LNHAKNRRKKPMHILEIAPPYIAIRSDMRYGGIERNILYLTEEFGRRGHAVTLAASGDSAVEGSLLLPTIPESVWINGKTGKVYNGSNVNEQHYRVILDYLLQNQNNIDVVHDHPGLGLLGSEAFRKFGHEIKIPILVTMHGSARPEKVQIIKNGLANARYLHNIHVNGISYAQRKEFAEIKDFSVIHHGIPLNRFEYSATKKDYLLIVGRISKIKGQHTAIAVAKKLGIPLLIAGDVHDVDRDYYLTHVKPHIDRKLIQYIGPVNDAQKMPIFRDAKGFLMPIEWEEPFGLVMIESLASGTPVVGFKRGSVDEIVSDSVTGFVIPPTQSQSDDLERFTQKTSDIRMLNPQDARLRAEQEFSIQREAQKYLELFEKMKQ